MGHLSTHVLDTANGCPAAGMTVTLQRVSGAQIDTLAHFTLNADGRHPGGALLDASSMAAGRYRLLDSGEHFVDQTPLGSRWQYREHGC